MAKIEFVNKENTKAITSHIRYNITAEDMNEIKNSVNALYDANQEATSWDSITGTQLDINLSGFTNDLTITKLDVGLGNVDNTTDLNKPISTSVQTALDLKQDLLIVLTQAEYDALDPVDETKIYFIVG